MSPQLEPATDEQAASIERAILDLRRARDLLAYAKATKAAAAVRRAIKSADGARRHVTHRLARTTKES